jgi:hypothetical protein
MIVASEPAPTKPDRTQALLYGLMNLLVLGTIVAGAAGAAFLTLRSWLDPGGTRPTLPAVLLVAFAAAVLVLLVRRQPPRSHRLAGLLIAGIVLSRLGYTLAVDQPRFSDFATMWDYAEAVATGPFQQPGARATGRDAGWQALVESRALPYLAPVAKLSGGRPIGYQIANSIAVGLCALLVYGIASSVVNRKAGLIALWLIAVAPEPLLAAEIPSHDIPGTLFALLALGLVVRMHRWNRENSASQRTFIGAGLLLGFLLVLADLQRSTGLFLLGATAGSAVLLLIQAGWRRSRWVVIATVIVPFLTTTVLSRTVVRPIVGQAAMTEANTAKWVWIAMNANSESIVEWHLEGLFPLLLALDSSEVRTFALARAASDIADAGSARIRNYAKRIATLSSLGSQYFWYLGDQSILERRWVPTRILDQPAGERLRALLRGYSEAFRLLFLLLAVVSVTGILLFSRPEPRLHLPLLVLAVLLLALGLLGETQSRYLFPAWFLLPIGMGWFLTHGLSRTGWILATAKRRAAEMGAAGILTGIALLTAVVIARAGIRSGWPRLIETRTLTHSGGAIAVGRYRWLLPADSTVKIGAQLPARGRVTAYAVRDQYAPLPCTTSVHLSVNDRPIMNGVVDSNSVALTLAADLGKEPGGEVSLGIATAGSPRQPGCPAYLWLLHTGQ